jgi:hypothetical protein
MNAVELQRAIEEADVTTWKEYQDGFTAGQAWSEKSAKRGELVRLRRWYRGVHKEGSFDEWFADVESDGCAASARLACVIAGVNDDPHFDPVEFLNSIIAWPCRGEADTDGVVTVDADPDDPVYLQGFIEGALFE